VSSMESEIKSRSDLESELIYLGLFNKAKDIYFELGADAVLSYIKSSHRLLSKVYHPDLNPKNKVKAEITQQRLNKLSELIGEMKDEEIIELIRTGIGTEKKKKKILVVEDETSIKTMLRDVFYMEGYDTMAVSDGEEGYHMFCEYRPDLVFTDVVMPRMSGLEFVKKIRRVDPHIKVIFFTGFLGISSLKKELVKEVSTYGYQVLSKPCKISDILDHVKRHLNAFGTVDVFV